jgi:hypothetical protein
MRVPRVAQRLRPLLTSVVVTGLAAKPLAEVAPDSGAVESIASPLRIKRLKEPRSRLELADSRSSFPGTERR